jgi:hypothetical protein
VRTSANPGRWLLLEARLQLVHQASGPPIVVDRESGTPVTLDELLRQFRVDPSDDVIGLVRITIEAGP